MNMSQEILCRDNYFNLIDLKTFLWYPSPFGNRSINDTDEIRLFSPVFNLPDL